MWILGHVELALWAQEWGMVGCTLRRTRMIYYTISTVLRIHTHKSSSEMIHCFGCERLRDSRSGGDVLRRLIAAII